MQPKIQCVKTGQLSQTNSLECSVSTLSESENVTIAYAGTALHSQHRESNTHVSLQLFTGETKNHEASVLFNPIW